MIAVGTRNMGTNPLSWSSKSAVEPVDKEGVLSCFVFFLAKKPFLDMRECISVHLYRVWRISKELLESCTTRTTLTTRYSLSSLLS